MMNYTNQKGLDLRFAVM